MTRKRILLGCLVLLLTFLPTSVPASAQLMAAESGLSVAGAWLAPTSDDAPAVIALTITNPGAEAVQLMGVSSPAADMAMLVQTTLDGDALTTTPLDSLIVEPGQTVALEPGAAMIALEGLAAPLVAGDAISFALSFVALDNAGEAMGEPFEAILAAAVLEEAPAETPFVILMPWARPTVAGDAMPGMGGMNHGGMAMGEATPEATPGMGGMNHGGMAMGEATPEATPGMGGMSHGGMEMADGGVSGVFMRILNNGGADDTLVAVESAASNVVEIHQTSMVDNVMQMRPLDGGLPLPVGVEVVLEPGSYHIMLIDLVEQLAPGEAILLTLVFESGLEMTLAVPVYDATMMMMGMQPGM